MILLSTTAHDCQPRFLYEGARQSYYCVIAPTYEAHWITAFHEFVRAVELTEHKGDEHG
jgi:hypothetical protein